jgi:tetratricopeptide (TPR) repeat protein
MKQLVGVLALLCIFSACKKEASSSSGELSDNSVEADSLNLSLRAQIDRLTRYIEANPSNWGLYKDRSMLYFETGRTDWAVHDIREAIKLKDDDPDLHYLRGYYALNENDTALARSEFQLASIYGSANPDVFYQQGQMRFLQKKYEAALQSYREAADLDSLDPIYPFAMGFLERQRGNFRNAMDYFHQVLELDSLHEKTLLQLHDLCLEDLNKVEKANNYNQRLLSVNPSHSLANYNAGSYFYRKAVPLKSSMPEAYKENINKAVEHYTISIGYSDSFALPLVYRGMCYVEGERYDLALEDFKKAVELDDSQKLAHLQLSGLYEYYGEAEKAAIHAAKAEQ